MGYYITQRNCKFYIPAKNINSVMNALVELSTKPELMGGSSYSSAEGIKRHFAFVDMTYPKQKTLSAMLACWRWEAECDKEGAIIGLDFSGEKSGDDSALFNAIAPFVKRGSYIEMAGEDGNIWRWSFDGKVMKEIDGKVTFRKG